MGDYWLILLEVAIGVAVLLLYLSARKTFSSEDVRRTVVTENERLAGAVRKLAEEFEARVQRAIDSLDEAVARAEGTARRLDDLLRRGEAGTQDAHLPGETPRFAPKRVPASDKHRRVIALSREGKSVESIAKEVQLGTGEVELVLNISKEAESPASYRAVEDECESDNPNGRS